MKKYSNLSVLLILLFSGLSLSAQPDEDQLGAWYMYFWNTTFKEGPWGLQGDAQFRNWNTFGDLEQLLLRGGVTYKPEGSPAKLTLGYAFIATGEPGEETETFQEHRIYQEALIPHRVGKRVLLTHRYRFEQRFVEGQDFRTRFRYNIFMNVPFNQDDLSKGAVYLALYNELFINGQREIGTANPVQLFDRNRFYTALGYSIADNLRVQLGYMQQKTNTWSKGQLQVSLHHKI